MSEQEKKVLVPALRFPEFRDDGKWDEKILGEMGEFFSSLTGKKGDDFGVGSAHFITYMNVFSNTFVDTSILRLVDVRKGEKQNSVKKGDVFFTVSSETPEEVGMSSVLLEDLNNCYLNSFCVLFRFSLDSRPDLVFLGYSIRQNTVRSYFTLHAQGVTRFNLNKGIFNKLPLVFPRSEKEQQKIADCLSSLDELITLQTQKRNALKAHKKGLMQQLFPASGETQPKLRFPEFRGMGEWEEKSLGDVCIHFKGFAFKSKYYTASGRRIVRVSDMGFDYIKNETSAIYIKEDNAKLYEKWKLMKDDLIITTVGSKPPMYDSLVGRTIVVELKDESSLLNQNAVCLRASKNIEQGFLNILFRRQEYISFIESIIRGNANQGSIALVDLFKYIILQPKPKEQQKIADCLSSLDALITAQTQKIDDLKSHKKGLMQQLFPSDAGGRATHGAVAEDTKAEVDL